MSNDRFKPENLYSTLMNAQNAAGKQHFQENADSEYDVQIMADKNVSPGKFVPNVTLPGTYRAHPVTIRAMRKDIFVAGNDEFLDLEALHLCHKCSKELDLQFWIFCPYCEAQFKL